MRSCSHECRVHQPNYYVQRNQLTQSDVEERLAAIGETFENTATTTV
jgi:UPF0176 protein